LRDAALGCRAHLRRPQPSVAERQERAVEAAERHVLHAIG
jgi:hypothetical protein